MKDAIVKIKFGGGRFFPHRLAFKVGLAAIDDCPWRTSSTRGCAAAAAKTQNQMFVRCITARAWSCRRASAPSLYTE